MWTIDTAIDRGQREAQLRAAPYLTPDYLNTLRDTPPQFAPTYLRQHRAYTRVRLRQAPREDGAPTDTPTRAYRQWLITATPVGQDDWTGTPTTNIAFVSLTKPRTQPWRVSAVTVT